MTISSITLSAAKAAGLVSAMAVEANKAREMLVDSIFFVSFIYYYLLLSNSLFFRSLLKVAQYR